MQRAGVGRELLAGLEHVSDLDAGGDQRGQRLRLRLLRQKRQQGRR